MFASRFLTVTISCFTCGCGSPSLPELFTSYDGTGPYAVTSDETTHIARLGDHRFVVEDTTIRSNGATLAVFPAHTKKLHIKKSVDGDVTMFADETQIYPASSNESSDK